MARGFMRVGSPTALINRLYLMGRKEGVSGHGKQGFRVLIKPDEGAAISQNWRWQRPGAEAGTNHSAHSHIVGTRPSEARTQPVVKEGQDSGQGASSSRATARGCILCLAVPRSSLAPLFILGPNSNVST